MNMKRAAGKLASALVFALLVAGLLPAAAFADSAGNLEAGGFSEGVGRIGLVTQALDGDGSGAVQVSARSTQTAALLSDGSVWTWGSEPKRVLSDAVQVVAGGAYYGAVKSDGSLWMWGENKLGQLGDGTKTNRSAPVKVLDDVVQVATSTTLTAAVKSDGSLYIWGGGSSKPEKILDNAVQVAVSGYAGTCAVVTKDKSLMVWRMGNSAYTFGSTSPTKVMDGVSQVALDVWGDSYAVIKTDGTLWTWGDNAVGVLGTGSASRQAEPVKILDDVAQVDLGLTHSAAVTSGGSLYTWGCNDRGQLGDGTVVNRYAPVKVLDGVARVAVGGQPYNLPGASFTVAVKEDGSLWSWGSNTSGQLGDGTFEDKASPICVFSDGEWLPGGDEYHFADEVPERQALLEFLSPLFWYSNGSGSGDYEYDSAEATQYSNNIIANLIWHSGVSAANLNDGTYPVDVFVGSGTGYSDPLGKFNEYLVCDGDAVEWVARNIFNVSAEDYLTLRSAGDNPSWAKYYYHEGKYYVQTGGVGAGFKDVAILSSERNGDRYDVYFRIRYGYDRDVSSWSAEEVQSDATYLYAQVALKEVDGQDYWTLYKLSEYSLDPTIAVMHRLYNPNSGEHFYTSDDAEWQNLVSLGWSDEGLGWTAPVTSDTPVYRMYNRYGGEHHYCMTEGERDMLVDAGWEYEGIGWYSDDAKTVPLYREYNPNAFANNHNYTTNADEHEWLLSLGWRDEGYAWYGV